MRIRLILSFVIIILVTLFSVAYFVRQGTEQQVNAFIYRGGIYGAEGMVEALEGYYQENQSWEGVEEIVKPPGRGGGQGGGSGRGRGAGAGNDLQLYDAQGVLVYDPQEPGAVGELNDVEARLAVPLRIGGSIKGFLYAPSSQSYSLNLEKDLTERLNAASVNAALIAGGLSLVLAVILTVYLMRPVRALTHAAGKMAVGDLSQRVEVKGEDEISALGSAFNQMAASLQDEQERRQVMTADIAHELRTPLAVQRANLEAMLDGVEQKSDQNIMVVFEQNKLLERLVADLRTLALADAGELTLELRETDINRLVGRIADSFQQRASRGNIQINTILADNLTLVEVDPHRIEQILVNLVENALQYSGENGEVNLKTTIDNKTIVVSVSDSGPGIPEESLPHVFDRFYRGDGSRSREYGGTGLGLAIARKLAIAHGGSLTAENLPSGGGLFTLQIPLRERK